MKRYVQEICRLLGPSIPSGLHQPWCDISFRFAGPNKGYRLGGYARTQFRKGRAAISAAFLFYLSRSKETESQA
jgi:hypothetical protein